MIDDSCDVFVKNSFNFVILQIRTNVVKNQGCLIIANWAKSYYKLVQESLIRSTAITKDAAIKNWDKNYYKLGQVLQIRTNII